jgi:hypothetical protein
MAVYVDDVEHTFGNIKMCHLWADTLEELLAMVDRIGVQRRWILGHPTLSFGKHKQASWVHFDTAKSKKALAIQHGAILTDRYGPLEHTARLLMADPRPEVQVIGRRKLDRVFEVRGCVPPPASLPEEN